MRVILNRNCEVGSWIVVGAPLDGARASSSHAPTISAFSRLGIVLWALLLAPHLFAANTPAPAPAFPKPSPATAFPELKACDPAGHPWRAAREDWDGARVRVRTDASWKRWLEAEQSAVDRWMAKHHDRVAWRCGWWHDFVSPKDGSHLEWTDEVPGEEVKYLHSGSDPQVEITPKIFAGWVFSFRGEHASMIKRAASLYRLSGDQRYAEWAAAQLDFYADHYLEWAENRDGARLYWQTLDVATNLIQYATAVRMLGAYSAPDRKAHWLQAFFRPQVEVLNRTMRTIHNIATWHRCAVMQVALVFDDRGMWQSALDGEYGFRQQIARGITSDYLWWEQSFGYNSYVVRAVLTLFTTAGVYGRAEELAPEMAAAENLMLSPIYLRFPDGHAPNPADNAGAPLKVPDAGTMAATYRVFPTSIGLQAALSARNWDALLDPPEKVAANFSVNKRADGAPAASLPRVKSRNLESTRMALLKSGKWQVFFHYGQLTRSHAQAEALNFAAFYGDTDISHDTGTVGYGSPLHRDYYTRGLNHNVPLVNGEGEEPAKPGELLAYSESPARVSARQPDYRSKVSAERTLEIIDDTLVDTARITSKNGPQRLGLALQLQGKVKVPAGFGADAAFAKSRPAAFGYWRSVEKGTFHDHAEFDVSYGKTVMRVSIDVPGDFSVWHGSTPDIPPRRRDGLYVELGPPAETATFKTTFRPAGEVSR